MKKSLSLIVLATLTTSAVCGTIYKVVLEDGTVLFTDKPVKNSQPLAIQSTTANSMPALASPTNNAVANTPSQQSYSVSIRQPANEATIRNNSGDITIASATESKGSFTYQLWFNGEPIQSNNSGLFSLTGINRGAHQYFVQLKDNTGKTLASSEQRTLYLHKASVLINRN